MDPGSLGHKNGRDEQPLGAPAHYRDREDSMKAAPEVSHARAFLLRADGAWRTAKALKVPREPFSCDEILNLRHASPRVTKRQQERIFNRAENIFVRLELLNCAVRRICSSNPRAVPTQLDPLVDIEIVAAPLGRVQLQTQIMPVRFRSFPVSK
jgi:hypothetical protein